LPFLLGPFLLGPFLLGPRALLLLLECFLQIHIVARTDFLLMVFNVVKDFRLQCPTEKVELTDRGHERIMAWDFEHDALPATIGIKVLLGVGLQLALVAQIDEKLLAIQGITHKTRPTVLCHKPVNDAETEGRFPV